MATGIKNRDLDYLNSGDMVGYFSCTYSGSTRGNVLHYHQVDYLSYNTSNYTFTVLRPFTADISIFGKGSRNASGTAYSISYQLKINGSNAYTGSCTDTGNGTPAVATRTFNKGDTILLSGSHGTTVYLGIIGFGLSVA